MLRHCELFGGIGGFSYAIEKYFPNDFQTVSYCDIDEQAIATYTRKFPAVQIHRDIRDYYPREKEFDLITCTFPCTGTSTAGDRTGLTHEASGLWREGYRIMCQTRPRYFIWEQPLGIVHRGLRAILGGCRMAGYHTKLIPISAKDLGAAQLRERLFIIAYLDDGNRHCEERWQDEARKQIKNIRDSSRWLSVKSRSDGRVHGFSMGLVRANHWAEIHEDFWTVPNGLRRRNDARRLAGKTVTPAQAAIALSFIQWREKENRQTERQFRQSIGTSNTLRGNS